MAISLQLYWFVDAKIDVIDLSWCYQLPYDRIDLLGYIHTLHFIFIEQVNTVTNVNISTFLLALLNVYFSIKVKNCTEYQHYKTYNKTQTCLSLVIVINRNVLSVASPYNVDGQCCVCLTIVWHRFMRKFYTAFQGRPWV